VLSFADALRNELKNTDQALMAGKDRVVSAMLKEEAMVAASGVTPETVKAEQHRKLSEPGSANV